MKALNGHSTSKPSLLIHTIHTTHSSFPFQPQSHTGALISSVLLVLFKILRTTVLPYTPNAALCSCRSSSSLEGRRVSFTLASSDTSGEKCLQAKDILHHRLPLVAQWKLSVVALMCSSHQHIKEPENGGRCGLQGQGNRDSSYQLCMRSAGLTQVPLQHVSCVSIVQPIASFLIFYLPPLDQLSAKRTGFS